MLTDFDDEMNDENTFSRGVLIDFALCYLNVIKLFTSNGAFFIVTSDFFDFDPEFGSLDVKGLLFNSFPNMLKFRCFGGFIMLVYLICVLIV